MSRIICTLLIIDFVCSLHQLSLTQSNSIQALTTTNRSTVSGYFLAGRFMTWLPVSYLSVIQGLSIIIALFSL